MSHFSLNFSGNSFFNNLPDMNGSVGGEFGILVGWESFLTFNISWLYTKHRLVKLTCRNFKVLAEINPAQPATCI
jgi:hypothetical protein